MAEERPLSELVAQGWEVEGFSAAPDGGGGQLLTFLLRRQRQHRVLVLTRNVFGRIKPKEIDV